jgi:hypothetical protein
MYVEACVAGPRGSRVVELSCTYSTKRVGELILKSTFNRLGRVTDEVVQAIMVDFILGRFPIFRIHIGAISPVCIPASEPRHTRRPSHWC